jgi:hypothetical protein
MHNNSKDISGAVYGRLTVINDTSERMGGSIVWKCKCSCGNIKKVRSIHLVQQKIKSCGCLQKESNKKHGMCYTPEYKAWRAMQSRCSQSASCKDKKNYFDRGISVSEEWIGESGFLKFLSHIGMRPSTNHSVDRIDNNGNYEPNNVQWADRKTQIYNRRIKRIENFSDEEMIQEMNRRGFRTTKMKKHGKGKAN